MIMSIFHELNLYRSIIKFPVGKRNQLNISLRSECSFVSDLALGDFGFYFLTNTLFLCTKFSHRHNLAQVENLIARSKFYSVPFSFCKQ